MDIDPDQISTQFSVEFSIERLARDSLHQTDVLNDPSVSEYRGIAQNSHFKEISTSVFSIFRRNTILFLTLSKRSTIVSVT